MSALSAARIQPSKLPSGYDFRRRLDGHSASGFNGPTEQATLVHTVGWKREHWSNPLVVHVTTERGAELFATERRPGVPIDLGISGVKAVYHDGMWADGGPGVRPRWATEYAHSITVRTGDRVFGVRGPRDLSIEDLVKVAKSLPLDS